MAIIFEFLISTSDSWLSIRKMPHKDGISHVILNRKENESLKTELEMYKMKIILDQIDKGTFSSAISSKVETITDKLLFAPYINLLKLNSHDHRATNIFGMVPPKFEELKFSEQKVFLEELDKQLVSNLKHQLKEYDKLTGGNVKVTSVNELNAADLISKNQKEILNLSQEYLAKLNTLSDINIELYKKMSEWVDIRLGLMLQKTHNDVSCSVLKGKLLELKEKLLNAQYSQVMYCNSPDNIPAFVNIQCDITEQINCLKNEIADFKKSVN